MRDSVWKRMVFGRFAYCVRMVASFSVARCQSASVSSFVRCFSSSARMEAFSIVENAAIELTEQLGKKLARMMRLPGMRTLFIRIWDPLVRKVFGPDNGFRNTFYPRRKDEYRMDVLSCPYCRYFMELGCPELTRIYCENDERTYGNLPGIVFERTGTLGKGADRCDFCIRKV